MNKINEIKIILLHLLGYVQQYATSSTFFDGFYLEFPSSHCPVG